MRKILLSTFITLSLLGGILGPLSTRSASAQVTALDPEEVYFKNIGDPEQQYLDTMNNKSTGQKAADADSKGANGKATPTTIGCLSSNFGLPALNMDACVASVVYLIMWIFSWFLWLAGKILDMSIYYTLNMADLMKHVPVVDIGWRIFRDLANILFIFILLWTAIGTILGLATGKTKEIIVNLVIVALLMNFSLFITKAFIDGSNIVALHFYNLIVTPNPKPNGDFIQSAISSYITPTSSFSGAFMEGLKIQTVYEPQTAGGQSLQQLGLQSDLTSQIAGGVINFGKIILIGIFGIILMITAAYVFIVAAILFIIRVVVLMMVMILSPLGFLSFVLPSTEHYAEEWKEKLISQSIFAPIYMALCYVVVLTIQTDAFKFGVMTVNRQDTAYSAGSTAVSAAKLIFGSGGADNGTTAGLAFVFNFILLIGLMLGSIMVAHKLEATGVEFADEVGKEARGIIGRGIARGKYVSIATGTYSAAVGGVGRVAEALKFNGAAETLRKHASKVEEKGKLGQKAMDVNEWDRKIGRSKFGTTEVGNFVRGITTGGKVFGTKATFGSEESVGEAYEEAEHLHDKALDVERAQEVARAALELRSELNNPKPLKTREELLANRPTVLPDKKDETTGQMRTMTEDEWVKDMQKAERAARIKQLTGAVQSAVTRLPSTGLVHLQEEVIKTVIPYATEKQVDELMKSTDGGWTMHDKEEFVEIYFEELKEDAEKLQHEIDEAENKKREYEQQVRSGKFEIDKDTGKVVTDKKGRAVHKGATLDANGYAPADQSTEIPEFDSDKSEAYRKVYAKLRRYMSDKGFELLNITKFHYSPETLARLKKEGKTERENLLRAVPIVGQIMKWGTVQNIRDPNKTSGYTDQFRVEIRSIKDATLVELLNKLRDKKDDAGNYLYRNTDAERAQAIQTGDFSLLTKDNLWEERMRDFLSGRSANESVNTPGGLRKQYEYGRFMGAEALRETAKKDPVDVTILLESAFTALKEHEEGKRLMTVETQQLIRDLVQTKEGWRIGQKMRNAEFQQMREALEKKFREEGKSVQFTDWSDPAQRTTALQSGLNNRFTSLPTRSK